MTTKTKLSLTLAISILAIALLSNAIPQAQAATKVDVTFAASGYTNYSGSVMTVDDTTYSTWSLPVTLSLKVGETYAVTALSSITGWDSNEYIFSSWTNGNGLTTASGTFTVPSTATTVTANYVSSTVVVTFSTTGLSKLNSDTILTIDGTAYDYWNIPYISEQWLIGSTHSITAASSLTGWDSVTHDFSSWTNGNGLTTTSDLFTTPSSDVTVTANYVVSSTSSYTAQFATSGLSNVDDYVLEIDGTSYLYSDLASTSFNWEAGSTHTITALEPVYSYDTPAKGFSFSSWTNDNGLTAASGTFTMPESDVVVTANYVQSTVSVTFSTSGLSNLNSDTILTIDSTEYDYWEVANTDFQWTIGSTHTVTAATSLTGYDSVTHYFNSWTNGNGLTTASGTFTTPSSDVEVTVNYATTTTTETSITITCTNSTVDKGNTVTISGTLTSGSTGLSDKTITMTYYNGTTWCTIGSTTTISDGTYSYSWLVPVELENGVYPLKASFEGDGTYEACSASTGTVGNGVDLTVLPESLGSIIALVACFSGALTYFKLRSKRTATTA